jgi:hypothetical protein
VAAVTRGSLIVHFSTFPSADVVCSIVSAKAIIETSDSADRNSNDRHEVRCGRAWLSGEGVAPIVLILGTLFEPVTVADMTESFKKSCRLTIRRTK